MHPDKRSREIASVTVSSALLLSPSSPNSGSFPGGAPSRAPFPSFCALPSFPSRSRLSGFPRTLPRCSREVRPSLPNLSAEERQVPMKFPNLSAGRRQVSAERG